MEWYKGVGKAMGKAMGIEEGKSLNKKFRR